jgi:hypothetical protein
VSCRHHYDGDSDFRRGVGHLDAHAVQPFLRVVHEKRGFGGLMDRAFDRLLGG